MRSFSGKELARLLERNDWQLLRVNGSHHIYGKQARDSQYLSTGTNPSRQAYCVIY
jgi:predicted RNA binding protein YcfA (HicA-like mRNA interferase family)